MSEAELDEVDRAILHALQEDARNNSNAEISERVGVSPSTIGNRIDRLEEIGVIKGYRPDIDYELAGLPLRVLFVCSSPITERRNMVEALLKLEGVVNVREMMTGEHNIHVQVVVKTNDDLTKIAQQVDDLGLTVNEEILMKGEYTRPSIQFGELV